MFCNWRIQLFQRVWSDQGGEKDPEAKQDITLEESHFQAIDFANPAREPIPQQG